MNNKKNNAEIFRMILVWGMILLGFCSIIFDKVEYFAMFYIPFLLIGIFIWIVGNQILKSKSNYKDVLIFEEIPIKLEEIYNNIYNNYIHELEGARRKVLLRKITFWLKIIILFVIFLIILFSIHYVINIIDDILLELSLLLLFLGLIWCGVFMILQLMRLDEIIGKIKRKNKIEIQYQYLYKTKVFSSFVEQLYPNLEYFPKYVGDGDFLRKYVNAKFDAVCNMIDCNDYITGYLSEKTYINIADVHVNNDSDVVFNGIFVNIVYNKNIVTPIYIYKNELKLKNSKMHVEMDSQEFEEYFDIYSEDKIYAMRLITSDVMDSLVNFYRKYQLDFEITLKDNNIYLRFHTGPMFEPKVFGNSINKEQLYAYYFILQFIIEITNKVDDVLKEFEV